MTPPPATMGFQVQVRASPITGSTRTANMLPSAHHIARPHLDSTHRRVVAVIGEHAAAVVDTNPDACTPGEDVPPGAEYFPCRCRIRVRPARIVDTSVEASPEQRPRPITRSHPTTRRATPLPTRNVRLNTPSVTNIVLTANPL